MYTYFLALCILNRIKEGVSVDGVRTSAKRELWGRGSKKKHTSKQEDILFAYPFPSQ